jgi:NAD(P)-dependent dehydrogenase (short-subunit alcohol dehydrogenase family)
MKVLITGTSRGIGQALTQVAKKAGHEVLAIDRKTVDLRSPEAAAKIAELVKSWGTLDVLINNAGIYRKGVAREDFMESFLVNSIVPFEVTQALLPFLRKGQNPRVVQVTSMMGSIADNASGGSYAYRSSKAALRRSMFPRLLD